MLLRDGLSNELDRCVYPVSRNELLLGFEGASGIVRRFCLEDILDGKNIR